MNAKKSSDGANSPVKQQQKKRMSRKKKPVTLSLQDLITQPRQLAHLPMMNKVTGYRVLIAVLQRLQGLWKISKGLPDRNGQLYLNFVTDEFEVKRKKDSVYNEGDVVFKLRLSDIADDPHYEEARTALRSLTHVQCYIPVKDDPGNYRTENLMQIYGRWENGQFIGTEFEVIVPRLTAENILDINLFSNYTRFVGYTAWRLRSSFSYPLYIYLSEEWRHHGEQFVIPMHDLRTRLGFVRDRDDPERANRYASWSQFCDKVLNQAQKELDKLAEAGGADFTFVYQGLLHGSILPPYKRPDAVAFTILPTEAGRNIKEENDYAPNREICQKMMVDFFHLHINQARAMLRRVTPVIMPGFVNHLQQRHDEFMAGQHADVTNIAAWMHKDIDMYIRAEEQKFFTPAEEIKDVQNIAAADSPEAPGNTSAGTSAAAQGGVGESHDEKDSPTIDGASFRVENGITANERQTFEHLKHELLDAWSENKTEAYRVSLMAILQALRLNGIHDGRHILRMECPGMTFNTDVIPYFWKPERFNQLVADHFPGYRWIIR